MFYRKALLWEAEDRERQGKWGVGSAPKGGDPRAGCQHLV